MKANPTFDRVCELLHYDPLTGLFTWKVSRGRVRKGQIAGIVDKDGYIIICIDGKLCRAGRLAWMYVTGEWPEKSLEVEHHNGLRGDNSWNNLRIATRSQNAANTSVRSDCKSGLKGAHLGSNGKYTSHISYGGRAYHLGVFDTAEEAHAAYCAKARELYGEFARFQ